MNWLSDTSHFIARSQCCTNGELAGWLGYAMIAGSICSCAAYMQVIVALHICRRTWLSKSAIWSTYIVLFKCVFFLCGLTHACTALAFVWPAYRLFAVIEIINGVIGLAAAMSLLGLVVIHSAAEKMKVEE